MRLSGSIISTWWFRLAIGAVFLVLAWLTYRDISAAEWEGGVVTMNTFTSLAYDLGGKWGAVGFEVLFGVAFVGFGLYTFLGERSRAAALAQADQREKEWRTKNQQGTKDVPTPSMNAQSSKCEWCSAALPHGATHCAACDSDVLPT